VLLPAPPGPLELLPPASASDKLAGADAANGRLARKT
jgi:hypothetical protein